VLPRLRQYWRSPRARSTQNLSRLRLVPAPRTRPIVPCLSRHSFRHKARHEAPHAPSWGRQQQPMWHHLRRRRRLLVSTTIVSTLSNRPLSPNLASGPARPGRVLMHRCWSLQQQGVWIGTEIDWPARGTAAPVSAPATPTTGLLTALGIESLLLHFRPFQCSLSSSFSHSAFEILQTL
jgi:hypothetical protein